MNGDGVDWAAAERVAARYGVPIREVEAAARALHRREEMHLGPSGQTIRSVTSRHVEYAIHALAAAQKVRQEAGNG